ncbi:nuclear transport factor 2 family protein [Maribacter sp. 2308TA10-17]|uniref:nuclear transport factor 2 family protein n=1 Tax=Maribacter sp. 2308TA10-17 TaxID=3386276 RepID=UPI0039BD719A
MRVLILFFLILTPLSLSAQMSPEEVVQKQLETYNNRDIDGFMSVIDTNITMHDFSTGKITLEGYEDCKKVYAEVFADSPKLHSKILTRTVFDNKVIDHEYITGRKGSDTPIELVLIYEVNDEKITKISVLRKQE